MLAVDHRKITRENYDGVLIIGGYEGIGKSTLGLHILEEWTELNGKKVNAADVDKIALTMRDFVETLNKVKRYEMLVYDEAAALRSRRAMSKYNVAITSAYMIIRGLNLYTVLLVPSIFELERYFAYYRARGYIHCYKRGRFAFWNARKLRRMLDKNKSYYIKNVWAERPLFMDHFPKYKGALLKPYEKKKNEKMNEIRKNLYMELYDKEPEAEAFNIDDKNPKSKDDGTLFD